jgi:hypothetical protein
MIGTKYIAGCKSNYNTITTTTAYRYYNSYILVSDRLLQTYIQSMQLHCSNGTSASNVDGLSVGQCRDKYRESMVGIFPFDIFNPSIVYDQMCKIIPWISATSVYIFGMSILRVWRFIEDLQQKQYKHLMLMVDCDYTSLCKEIIIMLIHMFM